MPAFNVNGSEVWEITGNDIVTIGNEESCLWQHFKFKDVRAKIFYSIDFF